MDMVFEKAILSYAETAKEKKRWEWNGETALFLSGIWSLYETTKELMWLDTVKAAMEQLVQDLKDQGDKSITYGLLGCGRYLFPLYRLEKKAAYETAAGKMWRWLQKRQDLLEGDWAEKFYLSVSFDLEYENQFHGKEGYHRIQKVLADYAGLAQKQLSGMNEMAVMEEKKAEKAAGYYLMGLIDSTGLISEEVFDHYKNAERYFKDGLKLIDDRTSPYAVYAVLKGCRLGALLEEKYLEDAKKALLSDGVLTDDNRGIMLMAYGELLRA
ncbi:hypothetical protein GPL15_10010 [Clostridium sp. MCC353]|uniref:glycoside hydrolase family 88 protein n=1 Tax=Clostridium sp. MCC353 TaxID=2592646 RepID=UPI001C02502B|nr:glycoside hydrolase family 88 protein [Clostridium sp. MCC353]MBT9776837.1 hypothetical protein [Clostridium sp. MCC353]